MIIHIDSRENKNAKIIEHFNSVNQQYIVSKCYAGDYINLNDHSIIIDLKQSHGDGIAELCANLTRTVEHERFKREIARAKEIGCKKFYILIVSSKITKLEDVNQWINRRGQVKPETLQKIMTTFRNKYKVNYVFCKKKDAGKRIIELLNKDKQ